MDYSFTNFRKIPCEIIGYIFSFVGETKNVRRVCKLWHDLSMDLLRNFLKDVQALNPERFENITTQYPKIKEESDYFYTARVTQEIIKDQNTLLPDPIKWEKISSFHPGLIFQQLKENEAFIEPQTFCAFGEVIEINYPGKFNVYHDDGDIFAKANWFREKIKNHALDFTVLYLYNCGLKRLPDEITKFRNLTNLELDRNQLISLPDSIGNLASLTELDLRNNQLTSLPDSIGNLASLTQLWIGSNQLRSLPAIIGNLASLTVLDLECNQLTTLPDSIGDLASLTVLDLESNQLISLPESIGNLTSLTELLLNGNQLISLPESIGNLASLTELWLKSNQLTSLSASIGNLASLTELDLESNQLTSLPDSIVRLTSLTKLWLWGNQLESLPMCVSILKSNGCRVYSDF